MGCLTLILHLFPIIKETGAATWNKQHSHDERISKNRYLFFRLFFDILITLFNFFN